MGKEKLQKQISKQLSRIDRKSLASKATSRTASQISKISKTKSKHAAGTTAATLIKEEEAAIGGVSLSVYVYYAKCIGASISTLTVIMYGLYTLASVYSSIWLSTWSTDPEASTVISVRNKYLSVYGVLGLLQVGIHSVEISWLFNHPDFT